MEQNNFSRYNMRTLIITYKSRNEINMQFKHESKLNVDIWFILRNLPLAI